MPRPILRPLPSALGSLLTALLLWPLGAAAQEGSQVVDIETRPGVTQRFVYMAPAQPKAGVILYAGGHGGLHIFPNGSFGWGGANFLVRARQIFLNKGFAVAVVDAPSDRQSFPYLNSFRESAEHAADAKGLIAWMRDHTKAPVWLIGTSRGTQSVASIAIRLADGGGPDGIVLTSTILQDNRSRPVTEMELSRLSIPVLVVHHKEDGCRVCPVSETENLMKKLVNSPRKELIIVSGGVTSGDPCEAMAHHGFNGIEDQVVSSITAWIDTRPRAD